MTCPECGTKIGVFRRKFSNTAYCSEACRQTARQAQNQSSLALLLSNKKRHLAQAQPAPAPVEVVELPFEPVPVAAREAVHSGVMASFAPYGQPHAHQPPEGVPMLEEGPAAVELGARWLDAVLHAVRPGLSLIGGVVRGLSCQRPMAATALDAIAPVEADWDALWQDAVLHAVRPGVAVTGWIVTAMSCLQPLATALPAPCQALHLPFTISRTRACDTRHPVWEPPAAEPEAAPEPDVEPTPSRWIAMPIAPARLADEWLGLGAASEFVSSPEWPQIRPALESPEFERFAACKSAPGSLPAGAHPGCAVDNTPLPFHRLAAAFDVPLTTRPPRPAMAACAEGSPWRRQVLANSPGTAAEDPVRWVLLEGSAPPPGLGKLSAAGWVHVPSSTGDGKGRSGTGPTSAAVKTKWEALHWRYEVRLGGHPLGAIAPDWNLLVPPVVVSEPAADIKVAALVAPAAPRVRPSLSAKDWLDGLRQSLRQLPDWTRRLAFHTIWLLPLALGAVWFGPAIRAGSSGALAAQWVAAKAAIQRRATIDIEDDFRGGLNHWNGAAGWAKSWSYDATGLLHPGSLSLYVESGGLVDYSVEFLGVIEKRALGWTYRTVDSRNYYAARLALTRRGNVPTLDLERYAVINGRQDRRVQLPLPVLLSNITSFRVRTDVKGSRFTTYLNGKIIDAWSDERLTRGGIGFFAEPDAVVGLHWVRVLQGDDLIGRLCAQVSSAFADKKLREALH